VPYALNLCLNQRSWLTQCPSTMLCLIHCLIFVLHIITYYS